MTDHQIYSLILLVLGIIGLAMMLILSALTLNRYQDCRLGSPRWRVRNIHLKKICALSSLFFLAMAASYTVLQEAWALLYLVFAFKAGAWWLRFSLERRT
jgi:hypothetical protein